MSERKRDNKMEESSYTLTSERRSVEVEEDANNQNRFYACYLVSSLRPRFRDTYIGFTVDPQRRMREHNGEGKNGAKRTQKMRPCEMVLCIYGFPSNVSALKFEWAWKNPKRSRALRETAATFKSLQGIANKINLAYTMLTLPSWQSLNVTVNFFSKKYANFSSGCPSLPGHMKVRICPMDELPCYALAYKKRFSRDSKNLYKKPMKMKTDYNNDVSIKKLDVDDGDIDIKKAAQNDSEEKPEMSRKEQFHAIQPSSSILSYVEDKLLGRRRLIELRRAGYNTKLYAPLDNVPNSTCSEREQEEENVFENKLIFFAAAKCSSSFPPPPELPEIAFIGQSNFVKSSLLNSLTRQWGVRRRCNKHGQTINFFDLGSKLCMVDLPSYRVGQDRDVKDSLTKLVKEYVSKRTGLKRVFLLINTKWGMSCRDCELVELMERAQRKYQIVLIKTDVVFPIDVARRAMQIEESLKFHNSFVRPVVMVSSKSGAGIQSLRTVLAKIGRFAKL